MSKVNITINGRKFEVDASFTILKAAEWAGIYIPVLCYYPELEATTRCRVCVVEVEGASDLLPSCHTQVREGMVINTDSPKVIEARKVLVELLLANHSPDCLTCEKNGECQLQDVAYRLGVKGSPFARRKPVYPVINQDPAIVRDQNKCIVCARCVDICLDSQVLGIWSVARRGVQSYITTSFDKPLQDTDCVFCGRCVDVCPVGALFERERVGRGRNWEMEKVKTICPYCGVGCTFDLNLKDGKVIYVSSNPDNKVNDRDLCVKGRFGYEFIQHPERLKTPLIREGEGFREANWEEAYSLVSSKLNEIKKTYGADSIGGLSSAKCTNEENYLFQKFIRAAIGTNNVDHCARLCHAASAVGLGDSFGSGAPTSSIWEIDMAETIFVIGSNTTETHPVIGVKVKRAAKNGANLIAADNREIPIALKANLWLRHAPGSDVALLNGIMNVIIKEGLHNEEFIRERTENFDSLLPVIEKYDPAAVSKITGIGEDKIIEAARIIGRSKTVMILYGMGVTQHISGVKTVHTLANLSMLTGNVGRAGAGLMPLRGQNNVQGSCDMGCLPDVFPGYQKTSVEENVKKFEEAWKVKLSRTPGLTLTEMMNAAGKIKALYIMGENPVISDPDSNHVIEALKSLDFLAVQEIFLSETAKLAHVVLPGSSYAEKEGTFTNTERRIQLLTKALEPAGDAKLDSHIICEISARVGYPMQYNSSGEVMAEIASLVPAFGGITYEKLKPHGIQWPCPAKDHPGTEILHREKFSRGRGLFIPEEFISADELPDKEFPLILNTGRILTHYHTGTLTRRSRSLHGIEPEGFVRISIQDARKMKIKSGDRITVYTRRGSITAKARITPEVAEGIIFIPFHFSEAAANVLTNPALDPVSKTPEYKVCAARIEKVN